MSLIPFPLFLEIGEGQKNILVYAIGQDTTYRNFDVKLYLSVNTTETILLNKHFTGQFCSQPISDTKLQT